MARPRRNTRPSRLFVAESPVMREVVAAIERVAALDAPVLIQGEVGTGRELVARAIHAASSRREAPFVPIAAGAVTAELVSGDVEGETDDALSRARAGTLLIKDICDLPRRVQGRLATLLRGWSQNGTNHGRDDARVCATGDSDLEAAADAGVLSRSLYARFKGEVIRVPPLRERIEDIPDLAGAVIKHYARDLGRGRIAVSTRAFERLASYPWPGNVAELKIISRRLAIRCQQGQISAADVDRAIPVIAERVPLEALSFEDLVRNKIATFLRRLDGHDISGLYDQVLQRVEKPLFDTVLEHTGGNQVRASEMLGVNRNTLRRKLAEHGIRARARAAVKKRRAADPKAG